MVGGSGVLALVPARGGSKSIPRKNIKPLGGVPLLTYSIEAGLAALSVDRVIVSTDDSEIADVARRHGADVPFIRPAALGEDDTPDLPVFQHALAWLEKNDDWTPEIVVQLRPTSPLRPPDCVDAAVELLRSDAAADSVRGVVVASQNPYKMWRMDRDGSMSPLIDEGPEAYNRPRQELPQTYWQTGHVDAIRAATIREKASMTGSRIRGLVIDSAYACDIDTATDWLRVEWLLTHLDQPIVRPHRSVRPAGGNGNGARWPEAVRLVVLDFDGVMTDNRVWVTRSGEELVAANRSDGLGLARLRRLGVELLVLSTESDPVVSARCRKLGLVHEQGVGDKGRRLGEILAERSIDPAHVVYVGNDVNDLDCVRLAGCGVAVADAHPDILAEARVVLRRRGGHGAVRELCDSLTEHLSTGAK